MKLRKSDFAGVGQVYAFTLKQQLKNRSNIVSVIILLVFCLASFPLLSIIGGGAHPFSIGELSAVCVQNDTDLPFDCDLSDTVFADAAVSTDSSDALAPNAVRVCLSQSAEGYALQIEGGSQVDMVTMESFSALMQERLQAAQLDALGLDTAQAASLTGGFEIETGTLAAYRDAQEGGDELDFDTRFLATYLYAILVLILCAYTATYIVRIIVEEKASRLVEMLMVSVRPLGLVVGKILAMMTYIFGMFAAMAACLGLSWLGTSLTIGVQGVSTAIEFIDFSQLRLNVGTVFLVLISLLLAYSFFSLMAGLAGTCCSRNEDVDSATGAVMFTVLAGYLVSCIASAIPSHGLAVFLTLCPIVNVFCAPIEYVCGNVSFVLLIVSWLEQALLTVALAVLTARVYRELLLSRGSRIRLRQLLSMAQAPRKEGSR